MLYIGADLGTSGIKLILMDSEGHVLQSATEKYPISYPRPGWSEQNPTDWWEACKKGIIRVTKGYPLQDIAAIGIDGQMHGLVTLDEHANVIRPAILWNDGRSVEQVKYLNETIGTEKISAYTGNIAFAGFTAPKLLWVREHEPEKFQKIRWVMLPKDYLTYQLTGLFCTDQSDAAGMLMLDVKNRCWSKEMLEICGLQESNLPVLHESYEVIGTLTGKAADELGLREDVKIIAGAGDNAAAAIGSGTVGDGTCNISLGTSGTVFVSSDVFREGKNNSVHNFAHADGTYHFLGCMLSAASCNEWWVTKILNENNFKREEDAIGNPGSSGLLFLPYLMGERSPHNNPKARGAFLGLRMDTTRADMLQAVLEGVAFGIRDSVEEIRSAGVNIHYSTLCGGGAKSLIWQQIMADVLNIDIGILANEEGPALGSAILAAVGNGEFPSVNDACQKIVHVVKVIHPRKEAVAKYDKLYRIFRKAYPATMDLSRELDDLNQDLI